MKNFLTSLWLACVTVIFELICISINLRTLKLQYAFNSIEIEQLIKTSIASKGLPSKTKTNLIVLITPKCCYMKLDSLIVPWMLMLHKTYDKITERLPPVYYWKIYHSAMKIITWCKCDTLIRVNTSNVYLMHVSGKQHMLIVLILRHWVR